MTCHSGQIELKGEGVEGNWPDPENMLTLRGQMGPIRRKTLGHEASALACEKSSPTWLPHGIHMGAFKYDLVQLFKVQISFNNKMCIPHRRERQTEREREIFSFSLLFCLWVRGRELFCFLFLTIIFCFYASAHPKENGKTSSKERESFHNKIRKLDVAAQSVWFF